MNYLNEYQKNILANAISDRLLKIWDIADHCEDNHQQYSIIVDEVLELRRFTRDYSIKLPYEIEARF